MSEAIITFANPGAQLKARRMEIDAAIQKVLDSNYFIHGPSHNSFEREFAQYLGVQNVIGVANGTDALVLALVALGIGEGDEVIVPSHTAPPTISAIRQARGVPVFVDVDPRLYVVTPDIIANAVTASTRAVIAVHLYGYPCAADKIRQLADDKGISFIEDCAQATGAMLNGQKVGTIGHVGCFSFFPTKNLGGLGDGGAIVTNDDTIAERLKRLRCYGWSPQRVCIEDGFNSRLDDIQAAILSAKLPYLDADNEKRRRLARIYDELLQDLPLDFPAYPTGNQDRHVFHLYVVATGQRDALIAHLKADDIACGIHYAEPVHRHPAFTAWSKKSLPATEQLVQRIITLPLYPELSEADIKRVCQSIHQFFC